MGIKYLNFIDLSMISLADFEVNLWTNVAPDVILNSTITPKSFEKIKIKNIETLDSYTPFLEFFESSRPYI